MTTANLSVGINTEKARADLNALKDFMRSQLSSMALSINEKSLEASIKRAMQGPTNGFELRINTAKLKTDLSTALNDAMSGAKVGGGSIDTTQLKAGIDQIKQYMATAANDPALGNALSEGVKKGTPKATAAAKEAGKAAGKAFAEGEAEATKTAKISYRVKEGSGTISASMPTDYTSEQVKALATAADVDKQRNKALLQRIDLMRAEFDLRKKTSAEELKALAASNATRLDPRTLLGLPSRDEMKGIGASIAAQFREGAKVEALRASASSKVDARTLLGLPSRDEMKGIGASIAAQFREGAKVEALRSASNRSRVDPGTLLGLQLSGQSAKSSASVFLSSESAAMGPSSAELVALKAKYDALDHVEKKVKQVGQAHTEATGKTKAHTAAMHDAHSAARGLASGMGMMWLTWGNIAPLLAGASLSHGFIQAMKAGSEFAYQLTFVKALGEETADSIGRISNAALELSKNSLFGPVELANGLRTLSQAGLSASESMKALPTVIDLATVGEMSMKDAAITLVGVMTAFNLEKTDFSKIGDVFAKAAAVSQTSVEQMTQAMKMASVVGEQYGASMGDTATALTLLAKMNITGTAAGTSLRNMLKELYSPTEKSAKLMKELGVSAQTATGELKPFPDIIFSLKGKLEEFNKASQVKILQGLFGERGAKEAVAMLSQTREQWNALNRTISESGGFMREVSAELEGTVKGSFKQAINTLQSSLIEAYNSTEGAAGKLAGQLKETFGSAAFKESLAGIVSGMLSLTNALVAMAPALAMAAGGWLALRTAMIAASVWTATTTAVAGATVAVQGMSAALAGSGGLLAAVRMLPAVGAAAMTSIVATTGVLGPLALAIGAAGVAWYLFRDRTAEAMRDSAAAVATGAESMRRNIANILRDVHDMPTSFSRKAVDMERDRIVEGQGKLLKAKEDLKKQYGITSDKQVEEFISSSTSTNSAGETYTKTGAKYDALVAYQELKKAQQQSVKDFAKINNTVEGIAAERAAVKDEATKPDKPLKNFEGLGGGGRADREAGKYESQRLKNVLKDQATIEKLYDSHYKRLIAVENASAAAGLITREQAEEKISELTEEQTNARIQINEGYHAKLKEMIDSSNKLSASQREQIEGEMERRGLLLLELQEEVTLKRELANIASKGYQEKFNKDISRAQVDLDKLRKEYAQKTLGDGMNASQRARSEGSLRAEERYAQLLKDAQDQVDTANYGGNPKAIEAATARLQTLNGEIEKAKQSTGAYFEEIYNQSQTAAHGWNKFWENYQEQGTTAAKVVEQSMESVTKNLEDAFSKAFETGKFDAQSMFKAIMGDMGKLTAKMAVSDLGNLLFKKGQSSSETLGMGKTNDSFNGVLNPVVDSLKKFWGSLTGATGATEDATAKTAEGIVKMVTKTSAESTATTSMMQLASAAQMAASHLAMMGGGSSGSGGGLLSSILGSTSKGGSSFLPFNANAPLPGAADFVGPMMGASSAASSGALDFMSMIFAANGAAFNSRSLQAFAKGGTFSNSIVNSPTLFRFANGTGLMGEAGPEAIMPLTRDGQGRLGVRYEGREAPQSRGNSNVSNNNINVTVNSKNGDPAEIRRSGAAVARQVANAVAGSGRYR